MKIKTPKNKTRLLNAYKALAVLFAVVVLVVPGCVTDDPEIESKLLLTVIGVDATDGGYRVTATAVMPQESSGGSTKRLTIGADGESVSAAIEKLSLKIGKKPELGLCGLIMLGGSFCSQSVLPVLKYMLASGRFVSGAYLVLSPERTAKETIEMSDLLPEASSNGLSKLIEYNAMATDMPAVTLLRFLSETGSESAASFLPCIEIGVKQSLPSSDGSGSGQGGSGGEQRPPFETEIKSVSRIALYRRGEFAAMLGEEETRGFTWSDEDSQKGLIEIDDFTVDGVNVGKIHARLLKKSYALSARLDDGTPKAMIEVKAKLEFEDRHKLSDLYKNEHVSEARLSEAVRARYAQKIARELGEAVRAMKEANCDSFGVGNKLHKADLKNYRALPNKDDLISLTDFSYDVEVKFE